MGEEKVYDSTVCELIHSKLDSHIEDMEKRIVDKISFFKEESDKNYKDLLKELIVLRQERADKFEIIWKDHALDINKLQNEIDLLRRDEFESTEFIKKEVSDNYKDLIKEIGLLRKERENDAINRYNNLKDKIIVTKSSINNSLDELLKFNKQLKGNGEPSIFQRLRSINFKFWVLQSTVVILIYFVLGGNFHGIALHSIKEVFWGKDDKTVQVDQGAAKPQNINQKDQKDQKDPNNP